MPLPHKRSGFTLIEISIVLVIVGLVVGGVFVARDLIYVAGIRNTVRQIEQINTSVNVFKNKYSCLPGDCRNTRKFGFDTDYLGHFNHTQNGIPTTSGDGNGKIIGMNSAGVMESGQAMYTLNEAGLIGNLITQPGHSGGSANGILPQLPLAFQQSANSEGNRGGWMPAYFQSDDFGLISEASGHHLWGVFHPYDISGILLPMDAYSVDSKIDDGPPRSGKVTATGSNTNEMAVGADYANGPYFITMGNVHVGAVGGGATNPFCVTGDTPYRYNVLNTNRVDGNLCQIMVKADF